MTNRETLKLVIVDAHPLAREMLVLRLSMLPEFTVCGVADNEVDAARLIGEQHADLAILDVAFSNGTGFDVIKQFKTDYPQLKLLVVSAQSDLLYAERMIRVGAHGYISKRHSIDALLAAVRDVARGQRVVHDGSSMRNAQVDASGRLTSLVHELSDREFQVFELIGMGHPSRTISERLNLSRHTVDSHRENIKKKLGLRSSAELTRVAFHWQLEHT